MSVYTILIIILMLILNGLLAAYEMGIAAISLARLDVLRKEKAKGAEDAFFMKTRIEGSLATIQLGITLAGAVAAASGGAGVEERLSPYLQLAWGISSALADFFALILFVIPLSLIIIILGELVPKVIAIDNREWVVLVLSPAMRRVYRVSYPVISLIEKTVKLIVSIGKRLVRVPDEEMRTDSLQELRAAASLARTNRLLGLREERIVVAAAQMTSRPVRDILLPAEDISMLWAGSTVSDAFVKAHLDMHTRFPVTAEYDNPQSIIGFANFKDIITAMKTSVAEPRIRDITRPITNVDSGMSLSQLLEMMIQQRIHIALVTEGQRVLGMVTIEDILEELVGEIEDEYDYVPSYLQSYGSSWIIGGGVPMNVVATTIGVEWRQKPGQPVPTLEQWSTRVAGHVPRGGEVIEEGDLQVMPRKFRRKRMAEAVVTKRPGKHIL